MKKIFKNLAFIAIVLLLFKPVQAQQKQNYPYLNTKLSIEERVDELYPCFIFGMATSNLPLSQVSLIS